MKIAHLILAHSEPEQLGRLVNRLQHPDAWIFIHLDKKAPIAEFKLHIKQEKVYWLTDRVDVRWGAYSIVQATLNGFRDIVDSGLPVDYVNLLSGVDYPLKSAVEIHNFLDMGDRQSFVQYSLVHVDWKEAISRVTEYHLDGYSFPGKYLVQKWMNRLLPKRKMPEQLIPVGRSQWFTITLEATRYILDYLHQHPHVVKFFKLTWAPDEMIFQTILYNSAFRKNLVNNNLRYIDWSAGKASPKILTEKDKVKIEISGAFFGRKFDAKNHPDILDLLDAKNHH